MKVRRYALLALFTLAAAGCDFGAMATNRLPLQMPFGAMSKR